MAESDTNFLIFLNHFSADLPLWPPILLPLCHQTSPVRSLSPFHSLSDLKAWLLCQGPQVQGGGGRGGGVHRRMNKPLKCKAVTKVTEAAQSTKVRQPFKVGRDPGRQLRPLAVTQKQETSARVGVVGTKAAGEGALGPGIVPPGDLCMGEAGERCEQSKQRL